MTDARTPSGIQSALGLAVRRLRISHGLTQAALASRSNMSRAAVQDLEAGGKSSLETFSRALHGMGEGDRVVDLIMPSKPGFSPLRALKEAREPQRVGRPR